MKAVPINLEKISDLVGKVINTKFNKPNAKVNNLKDKIPYATILIHINQYNTDKKYWIEKLEMFVKKDT